MLLALHPGIIFALAIGLFLVLHLAVRWPLPLSLVVVAAAAALLGDFGIPFRHLVEGGFGYINLVMALFAGAFFGQVMRQSGAADKVAAGLVRAVGGRVLPVLILAALPLFVVGMFVGIAGVGVLAAGVFAVPAMRRIGFEDAAIAAFIAVIATAGMIAPPVNVPAMLIADGVNMPYSNVALSLLALSLPLAAVALIWFAWRGRTLPAVNPGTTDEDGGWTATLRGLAPLAVIVFIWLISRVFGDFIVDPATPLILVIGGLVALPRLSWAQMRSATLATFSGTPLLLAAVLVTVGVLVQIMTLTGIRGWLVISTMSLEAPWNIPSLILGMPLLGGVLTAMGSSAVIGVPAAFSFIQQDMILNVSALAALSTLAEFVPPTAIAAALSCYVVGGATIGQVVRYSWPPMAVLAVLSVLMLLLAPQLTGILT